MSGSEWNFNKAWNDFDEQQPPFNELVYCLVEYDTKHSDDLPFVIELARKKRTKPDMGSTEKWVVHDPGDVYFLSEIHGVLFDPYENEYELHQPFTVIKWRYK